MLNPYRRIVPRLNWRGILLVAAILILLGITYNFALAGSVTSLTVGPGSITITQSDVSAEPRIITVPRMSSEGRDARIKAWLDFCQPVPVPNRDGVEILHYSHAGCDVGRSQ
jgi:hypothetical protein